MKRAATISICIACACFAFAFRASAQTSPANDAVDAIETLPVPPPPPWPSSSPKILAPPPSASSGARAIVDAPISGQQTRSPTGAPGAESQEVDSDESSNSYWHRGHARKFLATAVDLGYLYFRPRVSVGYGKPFWRWIGIDANPAVSNKYLAGYAGLRLALPIVELRAGARYTRDWSQYYLAPGAGYDRIEFESQALSLSSYTNLEAEATGGFPLGPGSVLAIASGTYMTGVPSGVYVYDDTLRVITNPPWIWRGRLGYAVRLGVEGKVSLAVVGDLVGMPKRDALVLRVGVVGSAALSDHIEVIGSLIPPIASPDTLGVAQGDFAQLGIRYRWATGSPPDVREPTPLPDF
jgi:hypothetical protein